MSYECWIYCICVCLCTNTLMYFKIILFQTWTSTVDPVQPLKRSSCPIPVFATFASIAKSARCATITAKIAFTSTAATFAQRVREDKLLHKYALRSNTSFEKKIWTSNPIREMSVFSFVDWRVQLHTDWHKN